MKNILFKMSLVSLLFLSACTSKEVKLAPPIVEEEPKRFENVSVHDPSVVKDGDRYFIIGSHLDSAFSDDLVNWTKYSQGVKDGNPLIPNVTTEMEEALKWSKSSTFWAGDVQKIGDKYYMFYNACEGTSPLSAIGVAEATSIDGPYEDRGIIIKSGRSGKLLGYEDTYINYNPNVHPNAIDPHVFFDADNKLWMVYGSYSGGIFILEMDEKTIMPVAGQGYGKKLTGGNHTRIEGPYILYNKDTEYYYLFNSYGGLGAGDGYQLRIGRSKTPDGPYFDADGNDLIEATSDGSKFFDDEAIAGIGYKLVGDYEMKRTDGTNMQQGYISPGHNSAIYDENLDSYILVMHTRFPGKGNAFEVRTHEMFFNDKGWPVVAPIRYSGYGHTEITKDVVGEYQSVIHELEIQKGIQTSTLWELKENNEVITEFGNGVWSLNDQTLTITIDNTEFEGFVFSQWDAPSRSYKKTLSLQGADNRSIWGAQE